MILGASPGLGPPWAAPVPARPFRRQAPPVSSVATGGRWAQGCRSESDPRSRTRVTPREAAVGFLLLYHVTHSVEAAVLPATVTAGPAEPRSRLPRGTGGISGGSGTPPSHIPCYRPRAAGWRLCRLPGHPGGGRCLCWSGLLRFLPGVWRGAACLHPPDNERGPGARTRSQAAWAASGARPGPAHPPAANEALVEQSTPQPGPAPAGGAWGTRGNSAGFSHRQGEGWQGAGVSRGVQAGVGLAVTAGRRQSGAVTRLAGARS